MDGDGDYSPFFALARGPGHVHRGGTVHEITTTIGIVNGGIPVLCLTAIGRETGAHVVINNRKDLITGGRGNIACRNRVGIASVGGKAAIGIVLVDTGQGHDANHSAMIPAGQVDDNIMGANIRRHQGPEFNPGVILPGISHLCKINTVVGHRTGRTPVIVDGKTHQHQPIGP